MRTRWEYQRVLIYSDYHYGTSDNSQPNNILIIIAGTWDWTSTNSSYIQYGGMFADDDLWDSYYGARVGSR